MSVENNYSIYRIVSLTSFAVIFVGIALHCVRYHPKLDEVFGKERRLRILDGLRILVYLLTLPLPQQRLSPLSKFRKLVYLLAVLCFAALVVTGFYPTLILGKSISSYWLILHTAAGGVFVCALPVLVCFWAENCRFNENLWHSIQKFVHQEAVNKSSCEGCGPGQKIAFWLIVILALPLILSIILSMFPLFGTDVQIFLLLTHRYCALLFALVIAVHTYLLVLARMKK